MSNFDQPDSFQELSAQQSELIEATVPDDGSQSSPSPFADSIEVFTDGEKLEDGFQNASIQPVFGVRVRSPYLANNVNAKLLLSGSATTEALEVPLLKENIRNPDNAFKICLQTTFLEYNSQYALELSYSSGNDILAISFTTAPFRAVHIHPTEPCEMIKFSYGDMCLATNCFDMTTVDVTSRPTGMLVDDCFVTFKGLISNSPHTGSERDHSSHGSLSVAVTSFTLPPEYPPADAHGSFQLMRKEVSFYSSTISHHPHILRLIGCVSGKTTFPDVSDEPEHNSDDRRSGRARNSNRAWARNSSANFMVYELPERGTLAHVLASDSAAQSFTWPLRVALLMGIAKALAQIHSASPPGYHRNIKPQAIMVDKNFVGKLSGFHFIHDVNFPEPRGTMVGTPAYMCPVSMGNGDQNNALADMYAFGVVMKELVSGKCQGHQHDRTVFVFRSIRDEDYAQNGAFIDSRCEPMPELTAALKQIALKCTHLSLDQRFANMSSVVEALVQLV